jgi:crotonobetainyl-CoA:carnitine CoA-transferase CaiB-like acyl-CoA transferase
MLPLEDIKILDTTQYLPGPFCSMWLGDMGADIIKIEETEPRGVEFSKAFSHLYQQLDEDKKEDIIYAYNQINRNKRSICLNLKSKEGQNVFYRLAENADVVLIEGRPGVSKRLGIGYETLKKVNPRIIQCEISAFGQTGPYSNVPAHDPNILGLSGILGITGTNNGSYVLPGVPIGDLFAGMQAIMGILAALKARQKIKRGQFVDVSMYNGLLYLLAARHGQLYFSAGKQPRMGERPAHVYETSDGKHLVIAPPEPWMWERLCRSLGMEEFIAYREKALSGPADDPICQEVCSRFAQVFHTKTRDEWFQLLAFEENTCATPVYDSFEEVFSDPHLVHQEMILELEHPALGKIKQIGVPVKFSETPGSIRSLPPKPGQHTEEILISAGYSKSQIEGLKSIGAIAQT